MINTVTGQGVESKRLQNTHPSWEHIYKIILPKDQGSLQKVERMWKPEVVDD